MQNRSAVIDSTATTAIDRFASAAGRPLKSVTKKPKIVTASVAGRPLKSVTKNQMMEAEKRIPFTKTTVRTQRKTRGEMEIMTNTTERAPIDSVEAMEGAFIRLRAAQKKFATYTQEQVDKIFLAAATAANKARIPLAKLAVEETGMGVVEDKVIKNHYASEYIYNAYRDTKTCGVIEEDKAYGITRIAEPLGVITAVIPTTNPTSTAIFKTLIALKTRNGILISPHPRAKRSTIEAARVVLEAAVAAGAPEGIIDWVDVPSLDLTNLAMKEADCILATGGPGMVKAAHSCGKPAIRNSSQCPARRGRAP